MYYLHYMYIFITCIYNAKFLYCNKYVKLFMYTFFLLYKNTLKLSMTYICVSSIIFETGNISQIHIENETNIY